jgi:cobalt-precorrin-5B (C1)-methyltransferase
MNFLTCRDQESYLDIVDLHYEYLNGQRVRALEGVSCSFRRGELTVLLGDNGSGKTTFLMLLRGLLAPVRGELLLENKPIPEIPAAILLRRIGFVCQDPRDQLFAPTVYESVYLGAVKYGLAGEVVQERTRQALESMEIWDARNTPPGRLSYGQQKRVVLAGALASRPEILLLDEPTAGLDPAAASNFMRLLQDLNKKHGVTVLMAIRDIDDTPLWADRMIVLDQGRIISQGSPAAVFQDPALGRPTGLRLRQTAQIFDIVAKKDRIFLPRLPLTIGEARLTLTGYHCTGGKFLRRGYTTGTCAAAAARAATLVMQGEDIDTVPVELPDGSTVAIKVEGYKKTPQGAMAWVIKDAGDDPDVTNGARIEATVRKTGHVLSVCGGEGVGIVTKPGLAVPPGQPAINPVPMRMIKDNVKAVLAGGGGLEVTISVPEGSRLARRTMNPQLGIIGGISILGTNGIVEPMSEDAFKASLIPQLQIAHSAGHKTLILSPGRRGVGLASEFGIPPEAVIMMSNFAGFILEECQRFEVQRVILWGHVGKLAKIAAGVFQTYNRIGDGRAEVVAALAAARGCDPGLVREILAAPTVEGMIPILREAGYAAVWNDLAARASLRTWVYTRENIHAGTVMFTYDGEVLCHDENALRFLSESGWNLARSLEDFK